MTFKKYTFEEIHDLTAIRVIVDEVAQCYSVLGLIHNDNGQTLIGLEQTKRDFDQWRFPLMPGFLIETDEGTYECLDYCFSSGKTRHVIITARPAA